MYKRQVEANYAAKEAALQAEIDNIESSHPGYDEYRYDLDVVDLGLQRGLLGGVVGLHRHQLRVIRWVGGAGDHQMCIRDRRSGGQAPPGDPQDRGR